MSLLTAEILASVVAVGALIFAWLSWRRASRAETRARRIEQSQNEIAYAREKARLGSLLGSQTAKLKPLLTEAQAKITAYEDRPPNIQKVIPITRDDLLLWETRFKEHLDYVESTLKEIDKLDPEHTPLAEIIDLAGQQEARLADLMTLEEAARRAWSDSSSLQLSR